MSDRVEHCALRKIILRLTMNNVFLYYGKKSAGITQLVEYKLPKLGVASSNLVARSMKVRFSLEGR